jgi:hypothetical protein
MRTFFLFLLLFFLSVLMVITMDLLVSIPLSVSFRNIIVTFRALMVEEIVIVILITLYVFTKPIVLHFAQKWR